MRLIQFDDGTDVHARDKGIEIDAKAEEGDVSADATVRLTWAEFARLNDAVKAYLGKKSGTGGPSG